jgi:hypothetical protein
MNKNAWRLLGAFGLAVSLSGVGCVVGSSSDTGGTGGVGGGGSGGVTGGTGGVTGGTGGTGATGGTTGGTGGMAGSNTGGSAGFSCDTAGTPAASCAPQDPTDACQQCQEQHCCSEWEACAAENPGDPCAWGGPAPWPNQGGEIGCFADCYKTETAGGADDTTARQTCAGKCASPECGGTTVSQATSDLVACLVPSCLTECLSQ